MAACNPEKYPDKDDVGGITEGTADGLVKYACSHKKVTVRHPRGFNKWTVIIGKIRITLRICPGAIFQAIIPITADLEGFVGPVNWEAPIRRLVDHPAGHVRDYVLSPIPGGETAFTDAKAYRGCGTNLPFICLNIKTLGGLRVLIDLLSAGLDSE